MLENSITNSILGPKEVRQIRAQRKKGVSTTKIAKNFGVASSTITDIMVGRTWRHVDMKKTLPTCPSRDNALIALGAELKKADVRVNEGYEPYFESDEHSGMPFLESGGVKVHYRD